MLKRLFRETCRRIQTVLEDEGNTLDLGDPTQSLRSHESPNGRRSSRRRVSEDCPPEGTWTWDPLRPST
jgi:hypothetical protein